MRPPAEALAKLEGLDQGTMRLTIGGHDWTVTKSLFSGGRAIKLVAERLDGGDYISANLYRLRAGPQLYPCEMPEGKVIDFLNALP